MRLIVFSQKFRELAQGGLFAPLFSHFLGRHPKNGLAWLDALIDGGGGQHNRARADDQVLVDADTTPEYDIVLDARHTCDGSMGTDEAIMADVTVVPNLAVVVEFGAALNDSVRSNASVDTAQGANFHVITNDNATKRSGRRWSHWDG